MSGTVSVAAADCFKNLLRLGFVFMKESGVLNRQAFRPGYCHATFRRKGNAFCAPGAGNGKLALAAKRAGMPI